MTEEELDAHLERGFNGDRKLVDGLKAWIASRPECVRKLALEFPIGTTVDVGNETLYLIGWTESDMLILSPLTFFDNDYDEVLAAKRYLCASHVRSH